MYECANSFITYNNLNIPSYDVHSVQARDQMLVNLYKLQQSFVKINNTITQKTKQQNQRIQQIRQRIKNCMQRIQQVQGLNKAICFISPGEYPIKYKFDPEKNVSIFKEFIERTKVNKFDLQAHYMMKHQIEKIGSASKLQLDNLYKFVLYLYGKLKCKKMSALESGISQKKVKSSNLGKIPNTIRYVDSLTVFDTYINPYKNYQIGHKPQKTIVKQKQQQPQQIAQQIISITTYTKPSFSLDNPNYKPVTQEIDDIVLDDDIGLEGVVDIDIDDFLNGMSTTQGNNVVEKRVIEDPYKQKGNQASNQYSQPNQYKTLQSSSLPPAPTLLINSQPASASNILPPPPNLNISALPNLPPPPPGLQSLNLGSLPPPPMLNLDLPPPILGPPPQLSPPPLLGAPPQLSAPAALPSSGGGGRSDLLKELQNPNPMARLKKTVTKQTPNVADPNKKGDDAGNQGGEQSGRPLSHMEALQQKIRNRFKALRPQRESDEEN